jgi:tetratricopeptide (TPR) repeat protein
MRPALVLLCFALLVPHGARPHGDLHERIAAITAMITADSLNGELYLKRGQLYEQHEEYPEAMADFTKALSLDPDLIACYLGMAHVYSERGAFDSGLSAANVFLANYPDHPEGLLRHAHLHQAKGKHFDAVSDLEHLVSAAADCRPEYYIELAHALELAYPDSFVAALDALDRGIGRLGFVISLYDEAIVVALRHNDLETALRYTDLIITQMPRKELWLVKKAELLTRSGRTQEALNTYTLALEHIQLLPESIRSTNAMVELLNDVELAVRQVENQ